MVFGDHLLAFMSTARRRGMIHPPPFFNHSGVGDSGVQSLWRWGFNHSGVGHSTVNGHSGVDRRYEGAVSRVSFWGRLFVPPGIHTGLTSIATPFPSLPQPSGVCFPTDIVQ